MKKFMKENYLNSNIKLNRFNGFLSVKVLLKVKDEVKKAREEFFKSRILTIISMINLTKEKK
ncbi:hypothetical protein P0P54_01175 [Campylobacter jejuni]|uniref:hypothetical protein n=1 Tax=Campylobacter jejuni TaxID=197 RepID=UPI002FBD6E49